MSKVGADVPGKSLSQSMATIGAISLLIAIAVAKVQLTAFLFSGAAHFPTAYSFYSAIITDIMLVPAFLIVPSQWGTPTKEMFSGPHYALTLIIFFTTLDLAFTNIALSEISISLQQCIAATNPFWTSVIESVIHRKWQHPIVYVTVTGLVTGAVLACISDVAKVNLLGIIAACIAVLSSASKGAFTHAAFRQFKNQLGPLSLLFWVDLLMLPIFIPWVLISGELVDVLKSGMSATDWLLFTGVAGLGGVRALTQMLVLKLVSATSMSTANIFTMALNIMLSFEPHIRSLHQYTPDVTPLLVIGIALVVIFSALYAYLKSSRDACCGIMQPGKEEKRVSPPSSSSAEPLVKA